MAAQSKVNAQSLSLLRDILHELQVMNKGLGFAPTEEDTAGPVIDSALPAQEASDQQAEASQADVGGDNVKKSKS